tara:strand:- start:2253 stop:2579 length:327 start_codon:yes stop_codon:yes gene_type:complete
VCIIYWASPSGDIRPGKFFAQIIMTRPKHPTLKLEIEDLLANEVLPSELPELPEPESINWFDWVDDLCKLRHGDEEYFLLGVKAWMKAHKKRNMQRHRKRHAIRYPSD